MKCELLTSPLNSDAVTCYLLAFLRLFKYAHYIKHFGSASLVLFKAYFATLLSLHIISYKMKWER